MNRRLARSRWLHSRSLLLYGAVYLFIAALILSFSAASVLVNYNPAWALSVNPFDPEARTLRANELVYGAGRTENIAPAAAEARRALASDPTQAVAYRLIGLDRSRRGASPAAQIAAATFLTRRDYIANLWLIENAVKQGRMDEAMRHIDATLRTSKRGQMLLFPILTKAVAEPEMLPVFRKVFRGRPDWVPGFLGYYFTQHAPAAPLARIIAGQPPVIPDQHGLNRTLVNALVAQRDFAAARSFARTVGIETNAGGGERVRYAHFEREGAYPPLDWDFSRAPSFGADIVAGTNGNLLAVTTDERKPNVAARQFILLDPGRYRLTVGAKSIEGGDTTEAVWAIGCAENTGVGVVATVRIDRHNPPQPVEFTAPANCRNYQLSLTITAGFGSQPMTAEFSYVSIKPI